VTKLITGYLLHQAPQDFLAVGLLVSATPDRYAYDILVLFLTFGPSDLFITIMGWTKVYQYYMTSGGRI
jgi:hypothetical protein